MSEFEKAVASLKAANDRIQNEFIDEILAKVEYLCEKANKASYEPTDHEREQFGKIATIVANMSSWF